MTRQISGLQDVAQGYRGIMSDVWGVLHNGQQVYPEAADALANYRKAGGRVVMITNSPRPNEGVAQQFRELGVADDVFDAIVTSGDVTRVLIDQSKGPLFHLGPERDLPLFAGLNVELTTEEHCAAVVCTGLFNDENEVPDDYRERLEKLVARDVPFICANPDIVVERGSRLIWCAGSLAKLYEELGGKTLLAGKPHPPIYELAFKIMEDLLEGTASKADVLAIGDGMPTDVAGAQNNGFDLLYISAGIHSVEYGPANAPDPQQLEAFLNQHDASPTVWMPRLKWQETA